ncbi:hypothetical protein MVI01_39280 [Myxococcus virescens]|uniref:Uncharacterized protein n=1 Tax=Myxococcus virescens TaxID=83456 RepID=A0A511HFF7_9BACT|nr:hypothetical protein MVI01_39280 [Myxococcus virescens]
MNLFRLCHHIGHAVVERLPEILDGLCEDLTRPDFIEGLGQIQLKQSQKGIYLIPGLKIHPPPVNDRAAPKD